MSGTDCQQISGNLAALTTAVNNLSNTLDSTYATKAEVDTIETNISALTARITALENANNEFIPMSDRGNIIIEATNDANTYTSALVQQKIDPLSSAIDFLKNQLGNLFAFLGIAAILSRLNALENDMRTTKGTVKGLEGRTNNLEIRTNTLEALFQRLSNALIAARKRSEDAFQRANEALNLADSANAIAKLAKRLSEQALLENEVLKIQTLAALLRLQNQVNRLGEKLNLELGVLRQQTLQALLRLQNRLNIVANTAATALGLGQDAYKIATRVQFTLDTVGRKATRALLTAVRAEEKADRALKQAPIPGKPGRDGKDGRNGINGINGRDGKDGEVRIITLPGTPGRDGKDGKPGRDGRDGVDGTMNPQDRAALDRLENYAKLIPMLVNSQKPLTYEQTVNAAAAGACRSAQPGGCTSNAIRRETQPLQSAIDRGNFLSGANLALSNEINGKMGDKLPGGLSGWMKRFTSWSLVQYVLNVLTFAATVHNALQLSSAIGETLGAIINNVFSLIGLKDSEGKSFSFTDVLGRTVSDLIQNAIGAENYQALTTTWAKANRIYQATTNVLNSLMNVHGIVQNALEVVGGNIAKVGNALRIWGVVGEKAYQFMNPQPSFDNKWTTKLEQLGATASTVQAITQVPLDTVQAVTELQNANTEFVKAVSQEPDNNGNVKKGIEVGEAQDEKSKHEASKAVSQPVPFSIADLFDGED